MRTRFFRQARRELREAKSDVVRQAEETRLLLRETAQRHMEAEASADGTRCRMRFINPSNTNYMSL